MRLSLILLLSLVLAAAPGAPVSAQQPAAAVEPDWRQILGPYPALGTLPAQFRPADGQAIRERGALIGNDRAMAGLHWPSDVQAGQRLGRAYATWWINQPEHRQLIVAACGAEWN